MAVTRPATPPAIAPRVVIRPQNRVSIITGKVELAATDMAVADRKVMFSFWKARLSTMPSAPKPKAAQRETFSSSASVGLRLRNTA